MAEFMYNNAKNVSTSHILFELNCGYHPRVSFEKDVDPRSRSRSANKLPEELRKLMEVCYQNSFHTQELQKGAYNERVKSCHYALSKKV